MKKKIMGALCALALLLGFAAPVSAQGSLPVALQQISDQNGHPIVGALLYFYQVGTVATRQDSFQDSGLTNTNQWPLPTDAYGRVPMFYVASGSIKVRLTDPGGLVIFDYPSMLVIGPSGGGGGGGTIDPTTIASTGDVKFRVAAETQTGWVRNNGNTIGNAISGATERANADTQALFIYLWNTFPGLAVSGGRGANALADFSASKTISTVDMRGFAPHGLDTMGAAAAGRLAGALFGSPYFGSSSTQGSTGGEASHSILQTQLPAVAPAFTGNPVTPSFTGNAVTPVFTGTQQTWNANQQFKQSFTSGSAFGGGTFDFTSVTPTVTVTPSGTIAAITPSGTIGAITPSGTIAALGSGVAMNVMNPFILGTYFMKL